jgi:hypothetical protein
VPEGTTDGNSGHPHAMKRRICLSGRHRRNRFV